MKVLLFAYLQEALGKNELLLEWQEQSVQEFKANFQQEFKNINLNQVMIAINESYAIDTDVIGTEDVVALIPPVSGG